MVRIKLARNSAWILLSMGQLKSCGERISSYSYSIERAAMFGVAMTLVERRTLV
jgi:hypothetical protein